MINLKEIEARCEAASEYAALPTPQTATPVARLWVLIEYDIPALLKEVKRLQTKIDGYEGAVLEPQREKYKVVCEENVKLAEEVKRLRGVLENIADDKGGDIWITFSFNPQVEARKALEQE